MQISNLSAYTGGLLTATKTVSNNGDTLVVGTAVFADTTGGAFNLYLPLVPTIGSHIQIIDVGNTFPLTNLTILRNGGLISGLNEDLIIDTSNIVDFYYMGLIYGWRVSIGGASQTLPYQPGTGIGFSANKNGVDQAINVAVWAMTKVTFTNEEWDTSASYDAVNSRFMPSIAGKYAISCGIQANSALSGSSQIIVQLFKNGSGYKSGNLAVGNGTYWPVSQLTCVVDMNGVSDYIEIYVQNGAAVSWGVTGSTVASFFQGILIAQNTQNMVPFSPTDITTRTSDYPLKIGETVYKTFTNATSIPLNVATVEGEYEIDIACNYVASVSNSNSSINPNNVGFGTSITAMQYYQAGAVSGLATWTTGAFSVGDGVILKSNLRVVTRTAGKAATGICILSTAWTPTIRTYSQSFGCTDVITPWTSLGTLNLAFAQTGRVIIRRIL